MAEETTAQFINRRKKELIAQIAGLRGQLGPKEAELAQITRMEASLTIAGGATEDALEAIRMALGNSNEVQPQSGVANPAPIMNEPERSWRGHTQRYAAMTIKELVIQALLDHFPNGGTAADIRDFIRDAYGKVIEPSSLRPQMHRLKADNVLEQNTSTDTWNLHPRKRQLYAMYNHPTSRRAMKELQDDAPAENENGLKVPRTRLGEI